MTQELTPEERERRAEERRQRIRQWVENLLQTEGIPWAPMTKSLAQSKLALVTACGLYLPPQPPFVVENNQADWSYRELPKDAPSGDFKIAHTHYDHFGAEKDINVVFPIDRLKELALEGVIGGLNSVNYSFSGYIPDPSQLVASSAPKVATKLKEQGVDAVLLTPC
ncbi:MAG: hypothetical protein HY664_00675 [Chloroflexi bacterium]|nr:hypothetical protein [Chloroflexota bacterium]